MTAVLLIIGLIAWAAFGVFIANRLAPEQGYEPSAQPLDSSYRRLRQEGKKQQGKRRKSKLHSQIIRRSFLFVLIVIAFSCSPGKELAQPEAPSCNHEYLQERHTQKEWCRLCGHTN